MLALLASPPFSFVLASYVSFIRALPGLRIIALALTSLFLILPTVGSCGWMLLEDGFGESDEGRRAAKAGPPPPLPPTQTPH
ncbi:hypothetical protein ACSQ67_026360 [Phaseolus vulgaris]